MLLGEQKSNFVEEKKRNSKMTRIYSNQTYVQESLRNKKNFMYKLQKEIDP